MSLLYDKYWYKKVWNTKKLLEIFNFFLFLIFLIWVIYNLKTIIEIVLKYQGKIIKFERIMEIKNWEPVVYGVEVC